ncbi:hypothetical protein [Amaricoccus sp.]|uniref:hypothetical protein n=1 Tax=Amaricoccus sp. TaxID=1872485 RepID=UPI001B419DC6|nr:hypothetical protein [Amaricoccus sp.]MBP7242278.1 hypothetical protein [Amaricoccus sp.]
MRRAALALAAGAVLVAACAGIPEQTSDRANCVGLFQQYDIYANAMPSEVRDPWTGRERTPWPLAQYRRLLVQNDCMTRPRDLAGLDAVAAARRAEGWRLADSGPPAPRPGSVHAGTVTSDAEAARAVAFFEGFGIRATSIGAQGLGRRVFIGPFRSQGAVGEAILLATEAGFVAPYASRFFRF